MDINALLEAFQDFEKRGKKEDLPLLEQFLGHVAKTGQPLIPWTEFKSYFIFKLESIMDDFNASTPEQRPLHNPNVEYVPFEEMKQRILKIVDGYNGIPFTIQRLCELLTDPKRNYTGSEKFLRGLEKNVMVVSCVYPTTEKNGGSNVNRMNGVMFPGNSSLYSDSRNVNGPSTPKPLTRLRLSLSSSLSTNGLSEGIVSKESESTTEKAEHEMSDSALSVDEPFSNNRIKNKHLEEVGEEECLDRHEVKRLKSEKEDDDTASEEKESESLSETVESYGEECACDTSCEIPAISKYKEPCNTATETCEKQESSSETKAPQRGIRDTTVDQQEKATFSEKSTVLEKNNEGFERSGDEEGLPIQNAVSSSSNTSDLTTDGDADYSNSMQTENKPGEQDRK